MSRFTKEIVSLWDMAGTHVAVSSSKKKNPEVKLMAKGKKNLTGKPEWCVVPMEAMEGVVRVFEHGLKQYGGRRTWLPGIKFSLLFSAISRHLFDWFFFGLNKDKDSGQHPLCHVVSNCLMLLTFINEKRFDDRGCKDTDEPMNREAVYAAMIDELEESIKDEEESNYDHTKKS